MDYILTTDSITKQFGKHKAVNAVRLHIRQGDIYGLIGRNGAGKTTLMKMIGGLSKPSEGDFTLFGKSGKAKYEFMSRIGSLIESPGIYPELSAAENLKLKCIALGVRQKDTINELLNMVGLNEVGKKKVKKFSLGMKQRLGIALALVGHPDLLILDEPINGLDPQGIAEIREIIVRLNREKNITFMISSHILEELSKIATNYGIIHNGILLQELTQDELLEKCRERIELKTDDPQKTCTVIEAMGITHYQVIDTDMIYIFEHLTESGNITMELAKKEIRTLSISVKNEALEDYYLHLTGGKDNV